MFLADVVHAGPLPALEMTIRFAGARQALIAHNIANISTTHNEAGERVPYQPRFTVFQTDHQPNYPEGAAGVKVSSIEMENVEPLLRYEPNHPDAGPDGMVAYPNVNLIQESVDAMEASRAYEANIGVFEITSNLAEQTLRILA